MVTGTYSQPNENEYLTVEYLRCLISRFEEESNEKLQGWVEDFESVSFKKFEPLDKLSLLREGAVLVVPFEGERFISRVEFLDVFSPHPGNKMNHKEVHGLVVVETLDPSMNPLMLDIAHVEKYKNDLSGLNVFTTVVEVDDKKFTSMDSLRDIASSEKELEEKIGVSKYKAEDRVLVVEDECIIDIFDIEEDIVSEKI